MEYKPTALDVFCGAGGLSLGFQNADCQILGGIDNNIYAMQTHHRNFPQSLFQLPPKDIASINWTDLPLKPGDVDILVGGCPCQVYSQVGISKMKSLGKDISNDSRNFLYRNYVKFLDYYRPSFFVMENVDNLVRKDIFPQIINELAQGSPGKRKNYPGYKISHQVVTASDYGVPQKRNRLFIVGVRQDVDYQFQFPQPLKGEFVSVEEAISDLLPLTPPSHAFKNRCTGKKQKDELKPYKSLPQSSYQKKMRAVISQESEIDLVTNHICRSHNPRDLICFAMLTPGGKYTDLPEQMRRYRWDIFDDKYRRLPLDQPAWTLTAHMRKDCLAYIHPTQNRSISVREAARLQSFPDHFVFDAPLTRMFELIGNSVPPLLAEAIARPIVKYLRRHKRTPAKSYEYTTSTQTRYNLRTKLC